MFVSLSIKFQFLLGEIPLLVSDFLVLNAYLNHLKPSCSTFFLGKIQQKS